MDLPDLGEEMDPEKIIPLDKANFLTFRNRVEAHVVYFMLLTF